ncbi:MAG: hypothetical protein WEB59_07135 [Thermoanaerobaculia bacterium]
MVKKDEKEDEQRLKNAVGALLPDIEEMSREDIDSLLEESGCDLTEIRRTLHATAAEIAANYRRNGKAAPVALVAFAEAMDDSPLLPRDPKAAEAKAAGWIRQLGRALPLPAGQAQVLEAYRKGEADLSDRDRRILDAAAAELRKRLTDDE